MFCCSFVWSCTQVIVLLNDDWAEQMICEKSRCLNYVTHLFSSVFTCFVIGLETQLSTHSRKDSLKTTRSIMFSLCLNNEYNFFNTIFFVVCVQRSKIKKSSNMLIFCLSLLLLFLQCSPIDKKFVYYVEQTKTKKANKMG